MGLFDSIAKAVDTAKKIKSTVEEFRDEAEELKSKFAGAAAEAAGSQQAAKGSDAAGGMKPLVILPGTHEAEDFYYGDKDATKEYRASCMVCDSFKPADSHTDASMICAYAPDSEWGEEGVYPSLYIDMCDEIYHAVDSYKKTGRVDGALEFTELRNNFYFKAKIRYYKKYLCYFYGFDRKGGFLINHGLCMVYPAEYLGTENEAKLMKVLDDAAATYKEEPTEEG